MKKVLLAAAAAMALSPMAMAGGLSYNYVDLRYADFDGSSGFNAEVSGKIADQVFLRSTLFYVSDSGVKLTTISLEGGYRHPVAPNADVYVAAGLLYADVEVDFGFGTASDDDTGYIISGGGRLLATNQLELDAVLIYESIFDDSDTDVRLGALFHATPRIAFGANYLLDAEVLTAGVRFNFECSQPGHA